MTWRDPMKPWWHHGELYPVTIIRARYGGVYEGGEWLAFHEHADFLKDAEGSDLDCAAFFKHYPYPIGRGRYNPGEAYEDLKFQFSQEEDANEYLPEDQ